MVDDVLHLIAPERVLIDPEREDADRVEHRVVAAGETASQPFRRYTNPR